MPRLTRCRFNRRSMACLAANRLAMLRHYARSIALTMRFSARLDITFADDSPASQFKRLVVKGDVKLVGCCRLRDLLPK